MNRWCWGPHLRPRESQQKQNGAYRTQSRTTLHCDVTCGRFKHREMRGTEWFCGVQLGGVKLPAEFPAARNSKSMVHADTGRWRQKNGRPMLIVGSRPAVYRMAVVISSTNPSSFTGLRSLLFHYHDRLGLTCQDG